MTGAKSNRPRILVTLDLSEEDRRGVPFPLVKLKTAYVAAVEQAGGTPLLAAPTTDHKVRVDLLELMDGLLVTGGYFDIPPEAYGGTKGEERLDPPKPARTDFETWLIRSALSLHRPILGICGGMQLLNVVCGGTLIQDIASSIKDPLEHEQPTSPTEAFHSVALEEPLRSLLGQGTIAVNTTHHQAVGRLGRGIRITGRAPDGVIEAVGLANHDEVIGVEWHPELLDDAVSHALYRHLVEMAVKRDRA